MIYAKAGSTGMGVFEGSAKERTPRSPFTSFHRLKPKYKGSQYVEFDKYPERYLRMPVFGPDGQVIGFKTAKPTLFGPRTEMFKAAEKTPYDDSIPVDIRAFTEPFPSAEGFGAEPSAFEKFLTTVAEKAPGVIEKVKALRPKKARAEAAPYTPPYTPPPPAATPWGTYILVGTGVLAVGVIGYFLVKGS